jgi:hypothetical protein
MFSFDEPGFRGSWADNSDHVDYIVVVLVLLRFGRFGSSYRKCQHSLNLTRASTYEKRLLRCA